MLSVAKNLNIQLIINILFKCFATLNMKTTIINKLSCFFTIPMLLKNENS